MIRKNSLALCLLLSVALAAGCKKKEEGPPPPKAPALPRPKAQPVAPVQKPISSATVKQTPQLDFNSRRDPFRPYAPPAPQAPVVASPASPQAPVAANPDLLPIQSFEVAKFKVVGIVAGLRENRALVVDPNGKGYVVSPGMEIGNRNGRITRITSSAVEVVERYKEGRQMRQKKTVLTLAKKR
ncbi:type IV pilus assembly lipoprotein PilP [Geomonas sp. Red276]